jgi:hypothetical protein
MYHPTHSLLATSNTEHRDTTVAPLSASYDDSASDITLLHYIPFPMQRNPVCKKGPPPKKEATTTHTYNAVSPLPSTIHQQLMQLHNQPKITDYMKPKVASKPTIVYIPAT